MQQEGNFATIMSKWATNPVAGITVANADNTNEEVNYLHNFAFRNDSSNNPVPTVLVGKGKDAQMVKIACDKTLFARTNFCNMPLSENIIILGKRDPKGIIASAGRKSLFKYPSTLLAAPGVQEAVAAIQGPLNKTNVFSAILTRVQATMISKYSADVALNLGAPRPTLATAIKHFKDKNLPFPHEDALRTAFAWSHAVQQLRPRGKQNVALATVDDVALEEERKALHREKIDFWDDPDAKPPAAPPATKPPPPVRDERTEDTNYQSPSTLEIGTRIIYSDPSSHYYDSPLVYTGSVLRAYLDPTDNQRVLYTISIDGEDNVDGVEGDMIQAIKNPGGPNASKTPTKRKPDTPAPDNDRMAKSPWNGDELKLKKATVTAPGTTIGAARNLRQQTKQSPNPRLLLRGPATGHLNTSAAAEHQH